MEYTVREAIEKLNKLIEENPKIGDASLGVYTKDDFYEGQINVSYDLYIEADEYDESDASFTFGEYIENEDDEYDEDEEDDEYDDDE